MHKKGVIIIGIILLILILLIILMVSMFPDTSKSSCGNRVADIANHPIKNEDTASVINALENDSKVEKATFNIVCRKVSFIVTLKNGTSKDDAKSLASIILDKLSDDIKSYYDLEVTFKQTEESDEYPFSGYKQRTRDNFVF